MRCPNCATENTSRAKFCQECGKRLPLVCADCGHEIAAGAKFCVNCGHPVTAAPAAGPPVSEPHGPDADRPAKSGQNAERRQLTVLFSDLVGSTALSERLDPEDYRELIAHYRSTVADIVGQYGGQVANFVGDGIVVYFGYPVAQEGSAYAAAITALEITEAAPGIAERTKTPELSTQVRVGLHTGSVVVGETGSGEHIEKMSLFGDTPNVAARIQAYAEAGQVVTSATTRRLIGSQLHFESLDRQVLDGVHEPMELFRVKRPTGASDMVGRGHVRPVTPMIGRKAEIALVVTRWEAAAEGDGQVMVVSGEAGIGKSRIVFALGPDLAEDEANQLTMFGSTIHKNTAFYSVKTALFALLSMAEADPDDVKRQKLRNFIDRMGLDHVLVASPIAGLLGFGEDLGADSAAHFPEREKIGVINALLQICTALAEEAPLLIVIDDAHWIDPSTLEFLSRWIGILQQKRCLLLITARPEFLSPWKNLAHVTALELNRFGRRETIALIEGIAGTRPPDPLLNQIVTRTDGVPLFIEELTNGMPPVKWSTNWDSFIPHFGGPEHGEKRQAGRDCIEVAAS